MKITKYLSLAIVFGVFVLSNSCDSEKLDLQNPNQLLPETYFKNEVQMKSAINASIWKYANYSDVQSSYVVWK